MTLDTKQIAARWKKQVPWVSRFIAAGKLPAAFRLGKQWRIRVEDIEEFEKNQRVKP